MKLAAYHTFADGAVERTLVRVRGGYQRGGWTITRPADIFKLMANQPWRRYYPPGYCGGDGRDAFTLTRMAAGGEWWVECVTRSDDNLVGPFPDKASAHAAWRMVHANN